MVLIDQRKLLRKCNQWSALVNHIDHNRFTVCLIFEINKIVCRKEHDQNTNRRKFELEQTKAKFIFLIDRKIENLKE